MLYCFSPINFRKFRFRIDEWEYNQRCYTILPRVINKLADSYCSTGIHLFLRKQQDLIPQLLLNQCFKSPYYDFFIYDDSADYETRKHDFKDPFAFS